MDPQESQGRARHGRGVCTDAIYFPCLHVKILQVRGKAVRGGDDVNSGQSAGVWIPVGTGVSTGSSVVSGLAQLMGRTLSRHMGEMKEPDERATEN